MHRFLISLDRCLFVVLAVVVLLAIHMSVCVCGASPSRLRVTSRAPTRGRTQASKVLPHKVHHFDPPTQPLPPVPPTVKYMGFYAVMGGGEASFDFSNLVFDFPSNIGPAVNTSGGAHLKFMYVASGWFLDSNQQLFPDYKQRWAEQVPALRQLFSAGKLVGFQLCDECVRAGASMSSLTTMSDTIRASFPRETGAIIWWNAGSEIQTGGGLPVPSSLDWLSTDMYRQGPSCVAPDNDFVDKFLFPLYQQHIFPNLQPNQSAVLVPGARWRASDCAGIIDVDSYAALETWDAYRILHWATGEPRIAAILPYLYKSFPPEYGLGDIGTNPAICAGGPGCAALYQAWQSIGRTIKGRTSTPHSRFPHP